MDKDNPNIFERAGQAFGFKKKKKKPETSIPAEQAVAPPPQEPILEDLEIDEIFRKIREMDQDLQKRIENVIQLSGMSKEELDSYIDDPKNFPPDQWSKMQHDKEELERKMYSLIGSQAKKRTLRFKKKKLEKGRRGKTLGSRKKWLQM